MTARSVVVSSLVRELLLELYVHLRYTLHLSKDAAKARMERLQAHTQTLRFSHSDSLCRYRRWRDKGWYCTSCEAWVFAYEVFEDGVIIHDMRHSSVLV